MIVGGALWVTCYFFFSFMGVISEKVGFAYRKKYLEAVLKQETGWFETFDVMEREKTKHSRTNVRALQDWHTSTSNSRLEIPHNIMELSKEPLRHYMGE